MLFKYYLFLLDDKKYLHFAECEEYSQRTIKKTLVNTLSLFTQPLALATSKCNATTPLVVGGVITKTGELPHMAAIGWKSTKSPLYEYEFLCGGSLISEKFVLTAAHCINPVNYPLPSIVRLGDQNIRSKTDSVQELDVDIKRHIKHEHYDKDRKINDIALLELVHSVVFTDLIRPACLWQTFQIDNSKALAAGWGDVNPAADFTENSDELMKVELDIFPTNDCWRIWQKHHINVVDSLMCAGVSGGSGGKDTCQGDSGAPLMVTKQNNNCLFYIIGKCDLIRQYAYTDIDF